MNSASGPGRRLFLDANVLFTAVHNPTGKAALLFEVGALVRAWTLVTSAFAVAEARRNLERKNPEALERFEGLLGLVHIVDDTPPPPDSDARERLAWSGVGAVDLPAKDVPIVVAALGCRATHLLTGDTKHFGAYMNRPDVTAGIIIQKVADFLATPTGTDRAG